MSKAFMIVASSHFASRVQIQDFLTNTEGITFWYACLPNTIFLTATVSANRLAKLLEAHFGIRKGSRFLIVEVSGERQGRLPSQAWRMFRNPDFPQAET
ncbi:MAG: hypothetical protein RLZZ15_3370 [Verrucomicrobiota bacterium]|jgi:hypothetical protein